MNTKKGLGHFEIIYIILGLITFIVLLMYFKSIYAGSGYTESLLSCNQFIKSVHGEEVYFDKLNTPTSKFRQVFSNLCASKKITINEKSVKPAVDLASDCWNKFNRGDEFIGPYMLKTKLCFYCGKIYVDDDIGDFNKKFVKVIANGNYKFNESNSARNLNVLNLDERSLPNRLERGNDYGVFYTIYKDPNFKVNMYNELKILVEGSISDEGGWTGLVTGLLADTSVVDVFSGVIITKYNSSELKNLDCEVMIPIKEYD